MTTTQRDELEAAFDHWRSTVANEQARGLKLAPYPFVEMILATGETAFRMLVSQENELTEVREAHAEASFKLATWAEHTGYLLDRLAEATERIGQLEETLSKVIPLDTQARLTEIRQEL